jgi:hypothetical protein
MRARWMGRLAAAWVAAAAASAAEAQGFNWDGIGQAFCRAAVAEDVRGLAPVLSPSLRQLIEAAGRQGGASTRMLLQGYDAPAPGCTVRTRNAAIVEVRRVTAGGDGWTDYLVVAPEADGTTRIDDILFATRRSETLRERLRIMRAGR